MFWSSVLLDELAGVLERRKSVALLASRDVTAAFLTQRRGAVTTLVIPARVERTVRADADDDHVMAAALSAGADAIATGDRDLLTLDPCREIRILSPAGVLELLNCSSCDVI